MKADYFPPFPSAIDGIVAGNSQLATNFLIKTNPEMSDYSIQKCPTIQNKSKSVKLLKSYPEILYHLKQIRKMSIQQIKKCQKIKQNIKVQKNSFRNANQTN